MSGIGSRIAVCRLIEKMEKQEAYCDRLGIVNNSTFHGKRIKDEYWEIAQSKKCMIGGSKMSWDYSDLSKTAKQYGGPAAYVQTIEDNAFLDGEKKGIIETGIVLCIAAVIYHGPRVYRCIKRNVVARVEAWRKDKQEVQKAKEELIKGMQEAESD